MDASEQKCEMFFLNCRTNLHHYATMPHKCDLPGRLDRQPVELGINPWDHAKVFSDASTVAT